MRIQRVAHLAVAACLAGGIGAASAGEGVEAKSGTTVRVTWSPAPQATRQTIGTLLESDGDSLTVVGHAERERIRISRAELAGLEVQKGHTRGWNAMVGAGIGLAIGLGVAMVEHAQCKGEMLCGVEFALPVLTTPAGALVGAAIPGNRRWEQAAPPGAVTRASHPGVRLAWSVRF